MKRGDLVIMKNRTGPVMMVIAIPVDYSKKPEMPSDDMVECGWFDNQLHWQSAILPVAGMVKRNEVA